MSSASRTASTRVRTVVGGAAPHLELMEDNPLGKLPTLIRADGTALYDSYVILEFLDSQHHGARLIPAAGPERMHRACAATRWATACSTSCCNGSASAAARRSASPPPTSPSGAARSRPPSDALEGDADALAATGFGIGHIAIGVALGYLDFRFPEARMARRTTSAWPPGPAELRRPVPPSCAHAPVGDEISSDPP
jgi:glutathione S-transferase